MVVRKSFGEDEIFTLDGGAFNPLGAQKSCLVRESGYPCPFAGHSFIKQQFQGFGLDALP